MSRYAIAIVYPDNSEEGVPSVVIEMDALFATSLGNSLNVLGDLIAEGKVPNPNGADQAAAARGSKHMGNDILAAGLRALGITADDLSGHTVN